MSDNDWKNDVGKIKEALGLQLSPVAVSCVKGAASVDGEERVKTRICRAILDAASGKTVRINKSNNACFGASWHLGLRKFDNPRLEALTKKFVVETEKMFCSYEALDNLISQVHDVPDNSGSCFVLSAFESADIIPQLLVFICNAEEACRIISLAVFFDGAIPDIKIGGPTCRMAIMQPLLSGELNLSFFDYTSRKLCEVDKDKLLISIPFGRIARIAANIDKCCAGTATIEKK